MDRAWTGGWLSRALRGAALLLGLASPALAQDWSFDPALCPTDAGGRMVVRLVSGLAFALEPGGHLFVNRALDPSGQLGVPPGCPGNPFRVDSLTLPFHYNAVLENRAAPELPLGVLRSLRLYGHGGPVTIQENTIARYRDWKAQGLFCEEPADGLSVCHVCDADPARPSFCRDDGHELTNNLGQPGWRVGTVAVGPPREGMGASALPPAWDCLPQWPNGFQSCTAQYQLRDGLSVVYEVDISDTPHEIIPDLLLSTDRQVRASIEAQRMPAQDGPDLRELRGYDQD